LEYYKNTLSNIQFPESKKIILEALEFLERNGFLKRSPKQVRSTPYGNLTSDLYIHPLTAMTYSQGLQAIQDKPDPITLIFIVCMAPDAIKLPIRGQEEVGYWNYYENNRIFFPLDVEDAIQLRAVKTTLVLDDYKDELTTRALEEKYRISIGDLTPIVSRLGFIPWLFNALAKLAAFHKRTSLIPRIKLLGDRITYGVKEERLPLINIRYVSRERAIALQNVGFKTVESIANANLSDLQAVIVKGYRLGNWAERIQKNAKQYLKIGKDPAEEYSPESLGPSLPPPSKKMKKKVPTKYKQMKLMFYD
jgi:replicative superfamily II helicase